MEEQEGGRGDGVLTLEFANGNRAVAVKAGRGRYPSELLVALGLAVPSPLLLLVGGADTLDQAVRSDLGVFWSGASSHPHRRPVRSWWMVARRLG
jgi:hypothetical protein